MEFEKSKTILVKTHSDGQGSIRINHWTEMFQLKAEQINKMTTIFTQNDHFFKPDNFD